MRKLIFLLILSYFSFCQEKTLKINIAYNPISEILDYQITNSKVQTALFEGLVVYKENSTKIIPGLSSGWEVSKDRKTYTFKIRKDLKFSDGSKIDANSFRDFFLYIGSPELKNEYAYMLDLIVGYKNYRTGIDKDLKNVGITVKDDYTLVFNLTHGAIYFIKILVNPVFSLVSVANFKEKFQSNVVSSGPFVLDKNDNKIISLKKNQNYWDKKNVDLSYIKFFISDRSKKDLLINNNFNSGIYDWVMDSVSFDKISKRNISASVTFDSYFLHFIYKNNKALSNQNITKALIKMLPVQKFRLGYLSSEYFVPEVPYYPYPKTISEQNEKEALELLKQAGNENGKGLGTIKVLLSDVYKDYGKIIEEAWSKLDFKTELILLPDNKYYTEKQNTDHDFTLVGWTGDYLDPMAFLELFKTGSEFASGFSQKEYDDLIDKSYDIENEDKRYELLSKAEEILLSNGVVVPILSNSNNIDLVNTSKVKNYLYNPAGFLYYKYIKYKNYTLPPNIS